MAGGQTEKEVINMAEVYNPQLDQWEAITARMSTPRVGLCMVSMGNMIYVMGKNISLELVFNPFLAFASVACSPSIHIYGMLTAVNIFDSVSLRRVIETVCV